MDPTPATADALALLASWGDDTLRATVLELREAVLAIVPDARALAVRFVDEDLTLLLTDDRSPVAPGTARPRTGSSLALRFAERERLVVVVTVYAHRAGAFRDRVGAIEAALGAVGGASVLDDDLALDAAARADLAPAHLRAQRVEETALGLLMGHQHLSVDEAEDWLDDVARTSGRDRVDVAAQVVSAHMADDGPAPNPGR